MTSFVDIPNGKTPAAAVDIQQIIDALKGTSGKGVAIALTAVNDAIAYALSVKNLDATNSRAVALYGADGNPLLTIDKNGVQASPYGTNSLAPVVTTSATQTLTNKSVGGGSATSAGAVGFSGTTLLVGDGTAIRSLNVGAWAAFTPTANQNGVLTASSAIGRYVQLGKTVHATVQLTLSQAGTAGVAITVGGLPVAAASNQGSPCWGFFEHSGGPFYTLSGIWATTTSVQFIAGNANAAAAPTAAWGVSPATGLAIGDVIYLTFTYEAA